MSGSLVLRSGVGTQMLIVSSSRTMAKSVVASSRPFDRSAWTSAVATSGIGSAVVDRLHLAWIEVDPRRVEARLAQFDGQRQADVAEADDAGTRTTRANLFPKCFRY